MNREETAKLLTKIAIYDNRKWDEATVMAWHEVLADVHLGDALSAVTEYFGEKTEWLMPAHVRYLSVKQRNRRLIEEAKANARQKLAGTPELAELEEDARVRPAAWVEWQRGEFALPE